MKVERTEPIKSVGNVLIKENSVNNEFKFVLSSKLENSELYGRLQKMMTDIIEQGEKICRHMDIKDMKRYREMIKDFVNEVVNNSHQFSRENFLDRRGRHRVYGLVKLVDKELDDLAQELMKEEKNSIEILSRVDEIRGLLLDMVV
ncbi:MAG: YaaR family protein [Eubacteriales bacterium]|nr:YaaR family protein [Eubacteriales bacterium]